MEQQFAEIKAELSYSAEGEIVDDMFAVLKKLKAAKPVERSEKARRYAICITELEKAICIYDSMICQDLFDESEDS